MSSMPLIAAFPMYDWPEVHGETDKTWNRLRSAFIAAGLENVPDTLIRRQIDLHPDADPDAPLDTHTLWRDPRLLFSQTCWGPLEIDDELMSQVVVVGQPKYACEGGNGELYSSAIIVKREAGGTDGPDAPATQRWDSYHPALLSHFNAIAAAGGVFAYNSHESLSGFLALDRDLQAVSAQGLDALFPKKLNTDGHRATIRAIANDEAQIGSVDCRSWALAQRFDPEVTARCLVIGWTNLRKGLPFITSSRLPQRTIEIVKRVAAETICA